MNQLTYEVLAGKTTKELIELCKAQKIQRWSGKRKKDLIALLCCSRTGVIEPQLLPGPPPPVPETLLGTQSLESFLETPRLSDVIPETVRDLGPFLETYRLSESVQENDRTFGNSSESVRPLEVISERIIVREPEPEPEFLRLQRLIEKIQGWPQEKERR
jgi:hypothetical protein